MTTIIPGLMTLSAIAVPALAAPVPQEAGVGRYFLIWFGVMLLLVLGQNALGKTAKKSKKADTSVPAASDQKGGKAPKEETPTKEEAAAPVPPAPAPNGNAAPSGGGGW